MKIMLHKTFLAIAIGASFSASLSAQDLSINAAPAINLASFHEVDNAPKYKKVQDVFVIDKIEYTAQNTIVHFRFECFSNQYTGCTFYAPGEDGAWMLKGNGAAYPLRAVRNVQVNGELKADMLTSTQSHWQDWDEKHTTYTCELYFDRLPNTLKMADLIEGIGYEKATDRFNCLDIKLKTWKEMAPAIDEPAVVEEPVVAAKVENNSTASNLGNFAQISWKAYPNPAEDFVNIELSVDEAATIEVLSMTGQQLQLVQAQSQISQINVSTYPSGTYLVRVTVGEHSTTQQIVKK